MRELTKEQEEFLQYFESALITNNNQQSADKNVLCFFIHNKNGDF